MGFEPRRLKFSLVCFYHLILTLPLTHDGHELVELEVFIVFVGSSFSLCCLVLIIDFRITRRFTVMLPVLTLRSVVSQNFEGVSVKKCHNPKLPWRKHWKSKFLQLSVWKLLCLGFFTMPNGNRKQNEWPCFIQWFS